MIFLRHPRVEAPPGLCYGRLNLAPGEGAETEIAAALSAIPPATRVLTSPSRRCLCLAEAIAARDRGAVLPDPRLMELDFGAWEGRLWTEIDRAESDPWAEDPMRRAPPGGETFAQLMARVDAVLADTRPGDVVVTHAGAIRAAWIRHEGLSFEAAFATPVPYALPIEIRLTEAAWPISR